MICYRSSLSLNWIGVIPTPRKNLLRDLKECWKREAKKREGPLLKLYEMDGIEWSFDFDLNFPYFISQIPISTLQELYNLIITSMQYVNIA